MGKEAFTLRGSSGKGIVAGAAAVVLLALSAPPAPAQMTLPSGFSQVTDSTGFTKTTAVTYAPDGRSFVAEKGGMVRVVNANGTVAPLIDLSARVNSFSDRGLLGIATDKDFASNGYLYLLYPLELNPLTPDTDAPMVSRLTRVTVNPDNTLQNPSNPETVILGTYDDGPCPPPDNNVDCIPADYKWHVIGTVRSDPVDGTLWVGTGDTHSGAVAPVAYRPYNEQSFAGKIIHIDRNGRGLPNHPFCPTDTNLDHVCTKLYAKGFRNPFRFTLRPGKGPVVGDVGAGSREEIDLLKPGKNYGWPCYQGTLRRSGYESEQTCIDLYAKEGTPDAATGPSWEYSHSPDGASVTAGPVFTGSNYPADYQGDIFVGDYVNGWIKRLNVDSNDNVTGVTDFATGMPAGGPVDLQIGPTGDLVWVDIGAFQTGKGAVRRFIYSAGNGAPTPRASADPTSGPAPLSVDFTGSGSTDPENEPLTYDWDFGDGSAHSSEADPSHTYEDPGTYVARLTVDDGRGRNPSTTVTINVGGDAPPRAAISAPADESKYRGGERVELRGSATDDEDGALTGSALEWQVLLHHETHLHEVGTFTGTSPSFVPFEDHDADSFYEIRLTARDSSGQTDTDTIEIRPEVIDLTLASSPSGVPLTYDEDTDPAPETRQAAVGYRATVSAPGSFVFGGETYQFAGWSDGGTREHEIRIPATNTTLTARYVRGGTDVFTFRPEADTYVDSSVPASSFGTGTSVYVDRSPNKQSFLRFSVKDIQGRQVVGARLRLFQADASPLGGRVFKLDAPFTESTTWDTRPAITGDPIGRFEAVSANNWYEVDLGSQLVAGDGPLSLAMDSTNSDGAKWRSRESAMPPELVVEVERDPAFVLDGITEVAAPSIGSNDSTRFAGNRRMAVTDGGRLLAVYGRGGNSLQLAWREPGGGWQTQTAGAVTGGLLSSGGSGSPPASIELARDANGKEHAWVVWSGGKASHVRPVQMRRLSNLDAVGGPTVGPAVTIDAPSLGAYRADVAFERATDGTMRGVVVWARRTGSSAYDIVTKWFTDLSTDTPAFHNQTVIFANTSSADRFGSLIPTQGGMRVLARAESGRIRLYSHSPTAPLTTWTAGSRGVTVSSASSPTGVALTSGAILGVADTDTTNGVVTVQRLPGSGTTPVTDLQLTGYSQPSLATDGVKVWLVMIRKSDGRIVSRERDAAGQWSTTDRTEIGTAGGGNHAWPNLVRGVDGRLRFLVRGPAGSTSTSAVLAYQRPAN